MESLTQQTFLATIKERYCLNPASEQKTYHLVLDLAGSDIQYTVGDCLGIYPENDFELVQQILSQLHASGDEIVHDRKGIAYCFQDYLAKHANLQRLPKVPEKTPQAYAKQLAPLLPRYYSIASSMSVVGTEAHLTVGLIDGTCSQYLCKRASLGNPILSIFHHPARHFSLPPEAIDKPILMVGPGTGIAPFRGFMQERLSQKRSAKNWLFFGERHRSTDFYYQNFWEQLVSIGKLDLDCAFSRDQEQKIYVQHKMMENSAKIWQWLQEGAYFFVCGDASKMAKDVDKTLHLIVEQEGKYSPAEAKNFIKDLKHANRYQRDVY